MSLFGTASRWFYEWKTKGKSYDEYLEWLQQNQTTVYARLIKAASSTFNRERAAHVIGIERWSAQRLHVLLGEPLVLDEYDGYAPSATLSMAQLAEEFTQTREATLALVRQLRDAGVDIRQTVKHNEAGELSAGAWLFYIENHTGRETAFLMRGTGSDASDAATASGNRG
jgi:hypothetical protein